MNILDRLTSHGPYLPQTRPIQHGYAPSPDASPALPALKDATLPPFLHSVSDHIANLKTVDAEAVSPVKKVPVSAGYATLWKKDLDIMDRLFSEADDPQDASGQQALMQQKKQEWAQDPELKALLDILDAADLGNHLTLCSIEKIIRTKGMDVLKQIVAQLTQYYQSADNKVEAAQLLRDALHDIAWPSDIDQKQNRTCTAASIQMKLALEDPVEYTKMLTTLALDQPYTTKQGVVIQPNDSWRGDTRDGRTLSCRIMQNAIMELENGSYDTHHNDWGSLPPGESRAMNALFGPGFRDESTPGKSPDELYALVENGIAQGKPVHINFDGHAVLVVGIDKSVDPPQVIIDSWGSQYKMSVDDFKACVRHVWTDAQPGAPLQQTPDKSRTVVDGDYAPPAPPAAPEAASVSDEQPSPLENARPTATEY